MILQKSLALALWCHPSPAAKRTKLELQSTPRQGPKQRSLPRPRSMQGSASRSPLQPRRPLYLMEKRAPSPRL